MLGQAIEDARRAVTLDERYAEAHATLSFVLASAGEREAARHAALRAVAIEPDDWMHQFRLANATWGAERLDALARALERYPDFPFAHFQRAMVYVARGAAETAAAALEEGLRAEQRHGGARRRFPASGLWWLLGMIALSRGDAGGAMQAFESEIASGGGHLYSAEFELGARLGLGFAWLATGRGTDAVAAFEPLVAGDGSGRALLGLALSHRRLGHEDASCHALAAVSRMTAMLRRAGRSDHAQMLDASALVARGEESRAMEVLESAVQTAAPGPFGWTLWIDPVFTPLHDRPAMTRVLAAIAARAA